MSLPDEEYVARGLASRLRLKRCVYASEEDHSYLSLGNWLLA